MENGLRFGLGLKENYQIQGKNVSIVLRLHQGIIKIRENQYEDFSYYNVRRFFCNFPPCDFITG